MTYYEDKDYKQTRAVGSVYFIKNDTIISPYITNFEDQSVKCEFFNKICGGGLCDWMSMSEFFKFKPIPPEYTEMFKMMLAQEKYQEVFKIIEQLE